MAATPVSTVTGAVEDLGPDLLLVAAAGIGIGATLFAVKKGWRVIKSMI